MSLRMLPFDLSRLLVSICENSFLHSSVRSENLETLPNREPKRSFTHWSLLLKWLSNSETLERFLVGQTCCLTCWEGPFLIGWTHLGGARNSQYWYCFHCRCRPLGLEGCLHRGEMVVVVFGEEVVLFVALEVAWSEAVGHLKIFWISDYYFKKWYRLKRRPVGPNLGR